jgi:hypothetical protein
MSISDIVYGSVYNADNDVSLGIKDIHVYGTIYGPTGTSFIGPTGPQGSTGTSTATSAVGPTGSVQYSNGSGTFLGVRDTLYSNAVLSSHNSSGVISVAFTEMEANSCIPYDSGLPTPNSVVQTDQNGLLNATFGFCSENTLVVSSGTQDIATNFGYVRLFFLTYIDASGPLLLPTPNAEFVGGLYTFLDCTNSGSNKTAAVTGGSNIYYRGSNSSTLNFNGGTVNASTTLTCANIVGVGLRWMMINGN